MDEKNEKPQIVPLITEDVFRKTYQYEEEKENYLRTLFIDNYKCTKDSFFNFFPITKWLRKYSVKKNLFSDIIAGITVAVLHIPHGLAYAPLGKVEPVVGFYMAVFPVLIYIIMGTSRQISMGTFAVMCAMAGNIVGKYETNLSHRNSNNETEISDKFGGNSSSVRYENIQIGAAVALMVGFWQAGLGFLKLGFCTVIMSESLVSGFTTGAAIHVISFQLKNLFGVQVSSFIGPFKLYHIYYDFFEKIQTANLVAAGISFICISILLIFTRCLIPLLQKKFPERKIIVPIEIVIIVLGILFSYFLKLNENYNVHIVKNIPRGIPMPKAPPLELLPKIVVDSFVLAILSIAINLSLAKIFAKKNGYVISNNQELFAYGFGNIFASFFSCLPACASLSRSSIQYTSGAKTQLSSFFSVCIILIVLLIAGSLFEPVPYCVLSSIVVVSLVSLLFQVKELPKIWKVSYLDGIVWLGTFVSVIVLDLDYGLGVGIILSVLNVVFTSCKVKISEVGRVPETDIYLDIKQYKSAEEVPKLFILQIRGLLTFINSVSFEHSVLKKIQNFSNQTGAYPSHVILCMSGVTQIDHAFVNTLKVIYNSTLKHNSDLYLTDCNVEVYKILEKCDVFKTFPREQVIAKLADAINYLS